MATFLAGRSAATLDAYRRDLGDFRDFTGAGTLDGAAHRLLASGPGPANALVLAYRAHLLDDRQLSAATVNRRLAALRSLVKLARTVGLITWSLDVPNSKAEPYRDTRGPGRQGFRAMLGQLERRQDAKGVRDRALLRLLYDLALRRNEAVSLDLRHIDLAAGTVSVLGKGRSGRLALTLPEQTKAALTAWLEVRGDEPGPLFTNMDRAGKGQRLTGSSVYRLVQGLGRHVGLTVRPHGLRHAAITDALDLTGGNVRAVQRFSRHADVRILSLYDDNRQDLGGDVAKQVAGAAG